MYKIMTAGPTQVRENVRQARSVECTNPDLDPEFFEFYKSTCNMLEELIHADGQALILGGEGMLALEGACASLTEDGDRVLVIDNGIFGRGFADIVKIYGGEPVLYTTDYKRTIDIEKLRFFLEKDSDFKYATLVHCDTPTGMLNDIHAICPLLAEYGILPVVDSVAGMFGEQVDFDKAQIGILCGGSQKVLSAPPGLAMVWVSDKAWEMMENRKSPIRSFYANLLLMKDYYKNMAFPYTMPSSCIQGLRVAVENAKSDKEIILRHRKLADSVRTAVTKSGLKLFGENGFSNTVTAIEVPEGLTGEKILEILKRKHNILLSGSLGEFSGKIIRIGHMGENANISDISSVMKALDKTFFDLHYGLNDKLYDTFLEALGF